MIALFTGKKISDTDEIVTTQYFAIEQLTQEQLSKAILVESVPDNPERQIGKGTYLHINPQTKELWYEYVDRPLTDSEIITQQEERIAELEQAITAILGGAI